MECYNFFHNFFIIFPDFFGNCTIHYQTDDMHIVRYIPESMSGELISYFHLYFGYIGARKMYLIIKQYGYWPNMEKVIAGSLTKCMTCSLNKSSNEPVIPEFGYVRAEKFGEIINFDYYGPLPQYALFNEKKKVLSRGCIRWLRWAGSPIRMMLFSKTGRSVEGLTFSLK